MRNRTHIACAARFRTVVVTLVSRVVSKMCAMANMVLILSCSCHAIRRRAEKKNVCVVFLRCAGEAGERLPLGKSEQFCAYLLFVGALAARLSDG